ncbi:serine-type D-Ala-D-Ala carboxypeptidase [Nibrella saemangeumensis]|uniref:Serine-type D-Ala-D-Ala carboxypeptidase n=1 Tax=Nibrella saemangeumensis TaxID=1084526 RepID=A0ABP8M891_9BACT
MVKYLLLALLLFSILSCSPARRISRDLQRNPAYTDHLTGFALYDPVRQQTLVQHNANQHFVPASNTKLFSFYAGLMALGDSIPALRYVVQGDSLIFWGTGNPLLLNPDLPDTATLRFLRNRPEKLFLSVSHFSGARFGPGWSWDDYNDYYSTEVTPFPIYGNIVRFTAPDRVPNFYVNPRFFADSVTRSTNSKEPNTMRRAEWANQFVRPAANKPFQRDVPFHWTPALAAKLLADTLKREVQLINKPFDRSAAVVYGLPADSLYKRMLVVSDNMLADHLLLLASSVSDTLNTQWAIQQTLTKHLGDLPGRAVWVDGSGLSRYNLFTPNQLITLLQKIYAKVPQQRLFQLLPAGGRSGTIKSLHKTDQPYVFAKSGSMSGVYNLSGYLVTRQGKVLLFSMMHNNFVQPVSEIRKRSADFLETVRNRF